MNDITREGREAFVRELIVRCLDSSHIDVYRRMNYIRVIEQITDKTFDFKFPENQSESVMFRKWMYMTRMLDSEKALDYLGDDFEEGDIFKFDDVMMEWVISLNGAIFSYLGKVANELKFGELKIEY